MAVFVLNDTHKHTSSNLTQEKQAVLFSSVYGKRAKAFPSSFSCRKAQMRACTIPIPINIVSTAIKPAATCCIVDIKMTQYTSPIYMKSNSMYERTQNLFLCSRLRLSHLPPVSIKRSSLPYTFPCVVHPALHHTHPQFTTKLRGRERRFVSLVVAFFVDRRAPFAFLSQESSPAHTSLQCVAYYAETENRETIDHRNLTSSARKLPMRTRAGAAEVLC